MPQRSDAAEFTADAARITRKRSSSRRALGSTRRYEIERDERIARNQAFLASLGLGGAPVTSAGASGKKKTPKKKRKGMTPSGEPPPARKSPRACAAVQPGRYAVGVTKRSSDEIAEEQDEKAERGAENRRARRLQCCRFLGAPRGRGRGPDRAAAKFESGPTPRRPSAV